MGKSKTRCLRCRIKLDVFLEEQQLIITVLFPRGFKILFSQKFEILLEISNSKNPRKQIFSEFGLYLVVMSIFGIIRLKWVGHFVFPKLFFRNYSISRKKITLLKRFFPKLSNVYRK